jgi:hypothetical protein
MMTILLTESGFSTTAVSMFALHDTSPLQPGSRLSRPVLRVYAAVVLFIGRRFNWRILLPRTPKYLSDVIGGLSRNSMK